MGRDIVCIVAVACCIPVLGQTGDAPPAERVVLDIAYAINDAGKASALQSLKAGLRWLWSQAGFSSSPQPSLNGFPHA
ncbi:hypothetical protein ACFL59_03775 [Planctomycetota bacterium]